MGLYGFQQTKMRVLCRVFKKKLCLKVTTGHKCTCFPIEDTTCCVIYGYLTQKQRSQEVNGLW